MKQVLIGLAVLPLLTGIASASDRLNNAQLDRVTAGAFELPTLMINCPSCVSASSGETSSTTNGVTMVTTTGGTPPSSGGGSSSSGGGSSSSGNGSSTGNGPPPPPPPPTANGLLSGHVQTPVSVSVQNLLTPKF